MKMFKKIIDLLVPDQRRGAAFLFVMMLIGMVLETLGVGFIIPAVGVMTTPDIASRYPIVEPFLKALGSPTQIQLIMVGMMVVFCIYAVKSLFLALLSWVQARFIFQLHASLSQRLFANYLRQPYVFHLQRNSAQLIRNVTTEVNIFTNAAQASLLLMTEVLVMIGILILLFAVEPLGAFLVSVTLGGAAGGFYALIRAHTLKWGTARQLHDGLRIQHVQQGLGGVKDIKLFGREEEFLNQYRIHNYGNARVLKLQHFFRDLPRLWLELSAVAGLVAIVLIIMGQGKPVEVLLPTLGLFGAAAFRLLPSINRCVGALQNTRFAIPVIKILHGELNHTADVSHAGENNAEITFKKEICLEHVTFQYADTDGLTLKDINFTIPCGESVGLVGGSGGGKSTLIDVIMGLLMPTTGRVLVDQVDTRTGLRKWQNHIGYVPQTIYLTDDSLRRNIALGLPDDQIDEDAVIRAIKAAQLDGFIGTLPDGLDTVVGERGVRLSGGQRQRIGIARALYHDPEVLVLDEATSSLDASTEQGVMEAIRAMHGEKTIIIVAHRLSTVEHCDRLYRLEEGKIVEAGNYTTIFKSLAAKAAKVNVVDGGA